MSLGQIFAAIVILAVIAIAVAVFFSWRRARPINRLHDYTVAVAFMAPGGQITEFESFVIRSINDAGGKVVIASRKAMRCVLEGTQPLVRDEVMARADFVLAGWVRIKEDLAMEERPSLCVGWRAINFDGRVFDSGSIHQPYWNDDAGADRSNWQQIFAREADQLIAGLKVVQPKPSPWQEAKLKEI